MAVGMSFSTPPGSRGRIPGIACPVTITPPNSILTPRQEPPPPYPSAFLGHARRGLYRTPPPSYSESQLNIVENFCIPILWSRRPRSALCPACNTRTISEVHNRPSKNTHLAALAMCLCGCWPFCLIPYVLPSCKVANHHCRRCYYLMGVYDPWTTNLYN